jgi:hypothetical protein
MIFRKGMAHQRQTCCHWQLPNVSHMRAWRHCEVPSGGRAGGLIGAIDGDAIGQRVAGHIGGKSIEFWQSGCIFPSTH